MKESHLLSADFWRAVSADPGNVENVRKLIFDLAISGKIVEQRSGEGNASTLLEEIRMIRNVTIKEEQISKFIEPQLLPKIPANWVWTTLAQIGDISPRNSAQETMDAGFVSMSLISEKYSVSHNFEVRPWGAIKKGYTHIRDGDVVLAKITPCFENGKSAIIGGLPNGVGAGTTEIHVVRPTIVDPRYIQLFWKSPFFVLNGIPKMTGTAGQKRLPTDYFKNFPFPLPPIQEQQRIAERVQQLISICDDLEVSLVLQAKRSREARKSAVDAVSTAQSSEQVKIAWERIQNNWEVLVGTPESIDTLRALVLELEMKRYLIEDKDLESRKSNWSSLPLREVCEYIQRGKSPKYATAGSCRVVSQKCVRWRGFDPSPSRFIENASLSGYSSERFLQNGDLLWNSTGTGTVGRTAVFRSEMSECRYVADSHVTVIRSSKLNHDFLYFWSRSPDVQAEVLGSTTGSTNQQELNLGKLKELIISFPNLAEQQKAVVRINELFALCDQLESRIRIMDELAEKFTQSVVAAST